MRQDMGFEVKMITLAWVEDSYEPSAEGVSPNRPCPGFNAEP